MTPVTPATALLPAFPILPASFATDGEIPREPARELARRELSRPEYHQDDPSLPERIWERFSEWLQSLIDSIGFSGSGGGLSWIVLAVIVVLIVAAAAFVWWRIGGVRRSVSRRTALLTGQLTAAADHRGAAERYASAGQWAAAIRERLRAIARDLEERVILGPNPGRTADELATEAAAALPAYADELRAAARIFDEVWYGERPGTETAYRQLAELDERLRTARPVPIEPLTAGSPS